VARSGTMCGKRGGECARVVMGWQVCTGEKVQARQVRFEPRYAVVASPTGKGCHVLWRKRRRPEVNVSRRAGGSEGG